MEYRGIGFDSEKSELTDDILAALEMGFFSCKKLPKDYRDFLLAVNGGTITNKRDIKFVEKDGFKNGEIIRGILGIRSNESLNLLVHAGRYIDRIPSNMIGITRNESASQFLLSISGKDRGKVYYWDSAYEADTDAGETPRYDNLTPIADSFNSFLDMLYVESEDEVSSAMEADILQTFNEFSIEDVLRNKFSQLITTNKLGYAIDIIHKVIDRGDFEYVRAMFNSTKPKQSKYFLNNLLESYPELKDKISILREDVNNW